MPQHSIIVPIFNGRRYLAAFFDSLLRAEPPSTEYILIDDGSTEDIAGGIPESFVDKHVHFLRNRENLGYAASVNRAFRACSGDIIFQLNTDLILDPNCLFAMTREIQRYSSPGIVGSKLIYPQTQRVQHAGMALGDHTKRHVFRGASINHPLVDRNRPMTVLTGATVAMTRQALDDVGPLDERYYNHNEDIDHCLRADFLGYQNIYCADSVAYHWESQSGPERFGMVAQDSPHFADLSASGAVS
jgi:hypothetical protein